MPDVHRRCRRLLRFGSYNSMMISRFFFPGQLPAAGVVTLPDALAHHAVRVLRLAPGSRVALFDGRGGEVVARLAPLGKGCEAHIEAHVERECESPLRLVLVQALASADKMDWVVQKAVELGVTAILPVAAERSVLRLAGERAAKRVEHWGQVAVAACEQSGRNRVPAVAPVVTLSAYLAAHREVDKLLFDPAARGRFADVGEPRGERHILVGPEGGWSPQELAACAAAGCVPASLGPRVLRTETAGLAALAASQALWGDL